MKTLLTFGQMLDAHERLSPNRVGARDLDRSLTFREWNRRSCRLANALIGLGLKKGDRVAVLAYNCLEWVEIYVGLAKAGMIVVPINFRLSAAECGFIIRDCEAGAIIAQSELHSLIEEIRADIPMPEGNFIHFGGSCPAGWRDYESLLSEARETKPEIAIGAHEPWTLMYTSGTTGKPKGVVGSHQRAALLSLCTEIELRVHRDDNALLVMPMCHANSLNFFTSFLYIGARVTVFSRPNFDAGLCLRAIGEMGITFTSLVPTHYMMMLDVPETERGEAGFAKVEKLMVSSAPARVETKRAVMEMFPNSGLYELYGSTEAGWVTFLHPDEQFDHLGTVGREVVGSAPVRLLDDDGHEVPDGQPGELYSCGPYAFDGYWNLPEKTAEAFRGPYLSVGDLAVRDEKGFIRLIDRKKNMIISGGENVYPTEVEAVLAQHPDVKDVAVVGCPDEKWGERVAAAVVLREGATLAAAELIGWTSGRLAGYKRPREILFLGADEMPRNATGKILHRVLRDMMARPAS